MSESKNDSAEVTLIAQKADGAGEPFRLGHWRVDMEHLKKGGLHRTTFFVTKDDGLTLTVSYSPITLPPSLKDSLSSSPVPAGTPSAECT